MQSQSPLLDPYESTSLPKFSTKVHDAMKTAFASQVLEKFYRIVIRKYCSGESEGGMVCDNHTIWHEDWNAVVLLNVAGPKLADTLHKNAPGAPPYEIRHWFKGCGSRDGEPAREVLNTHLRHEDAFSKAWKKARSSSRQYLECVQHLPEYKQQLETIQNKSNTKRFSAARVTAERVRSVLRTAVAKHYLGDPDLHSNSASLDCSDHNVPGTPPSLLQAPSIGLNPVSPPGGLMPSIEASSTVFSKGSTRNHTSDTPSQMGADDDPLNALLRYGNAPSPWDHTSLPQMSNGDLSNALGQYGGAQSLDATICMWDPPPTHREFDLSTLSALRDSLRV